MGQRLELQTLLENLLPEGNVNVYFQPPENIMMQYPCIVYQRNYVRTEFADNKPYGKTKRYMVTIIYDDPDSDLPELVAALPLSSFQRFLVSNNLNHDYYNLYF